MSNFLRMDLYRLVRSESFWAMLIVVAVMSAISMGMLWWVSTPYFAESMAAMPGSGMTLGVTDGSSTSVDMAETAAAVSQIVGTTMLRNYGNMWISGGALAMIIGIFVALFLSSEFERGFAKNIFTAQTNRFAFFVSKALVILLATVVFVAFSFALQALGVAVLALPVEIPPLSDAVIWLGLVVLVLFALQMIVALIVWLTRRVVAGVLAAILLAGGIVMQLISPLFALVPALKHVPDFLLSGCMSSLAQATDIAGPLGVGHVAMVGVAFLVVYSVASIIVLKKRDI